MSVKYILWSIILKNHDFPKSLDIDHKALQNIESQELLKKITTFSKNLYRAILICIIKKI